MKIYQLRCAEGHSEDFWPKKTSSSLTKAKEAFKEYWEECIAEDGDVFSENFELVIDQKNSKFYSLPGFGGYFVHEINVDE